MNDHELICRTVISSSNQGRKSTIEQHGINPLRGRQCKIVHGVPPSGLARGRRPDRSSARYSMRTSAKRRGGLGILTSGLVAIGVASRKACYGGPSASKPGISGSSQWGSFDVEVKQPGWADARWSSRAAQWGAWCFDSAWWRASLRARAAMGKNSPWDIRRCLFIGLGFLSRAEDELYLVEGLNSSSDPGFIWIWRSSSTSRWLNMGYILA
jgi:hypothetical protein